MISSAGFEPAPVPAQILASAPAPTPDSYHAFQAKSFFTNWKLKIQNLNYIISKRCFDIFIDNSKTLFWIFKENKWLKMESELHLSGYLFCSKRRRSTMNLLV